jgi:hypothetical protein
MLHAMNLGFTHPVSEKYMEFEAPVPDDMRGIIEDKLNIDKGIL